jgi:tetratricopeptide (TPR) repeat protein
MNQHLIDLLESQWKKDPSSRVFLRLAEEYRRAGRFGEAMGVCHAGLQQHPKYLPGLVCLGRCQLASGLLHEAEATFLSARRLDGENVPVLQGLMDIYQRESRGEALLPILKDLAIWDDSEDLRRQIRSLENISVKSNATEEKSMFDFSSGHVAEMSPFVSTTANRTLFTSENSTPLDSPGQEHPAELDPLAEMEKLMVEAEQGMLDGESSGHIMAAGITELELPVPEDLYSQDSPLLEEQLARMEQTQLPSSASARKIRALSLWLRRIKESHHVS